MPKSVPLWLCLLAWGAAMICAQAVSNWQIGETVQVQMKNGARTCVIVAKEGDKYRVRDLETNKSGLIGPERLSRSAAAQKLLAEKAKLAKLAEEAAAQKLLAEKAKLAKLAEEDVKYPGTSSDGRYRISVDGAIWDTQTNLEWYEGPDRDTNWDAAKAWTDSLAVDGGGWRMPDIEELRVLYQAGKNKGSRNLDPVFKTTGWYIWSAVLTNASARFFTFRDGIEYEFDRSDANGYRGLATRFRSQ